MKTVAAGKAWPGSDDGTVVAGQPRRPTDGEEKVNMEEKIRQVLGELRASLQADGGDMEVVSIVGPKVTLRLKGACGCCPHAQMTIKSGIERILRQKVSQDIVVERAA
jgi:Fe-S cluster biogenesis protein NfuA